MTKINFKVRRNKVFECIVTAYVELGAPVGSVTLCNRSNLNVSPATIRNIMRELEEVGYISQPHISAGRVPTDTGYRFYIDNIMESDTVTRQEQENICSVCRSAKGQLDVLLETALKLLSDISNEASLVLFPRIKKDLLKEIKLVSFTGNKAAAILITVSGLIKIKNFEHKDSIGDAHLQKVARIINNSCTNKPLDNVKEILQLIALSADDFSYYLCKDALDILEEIDILSETDKLFLEGTHYLFGQPEFKDNKRSGRLLKILEEKRELLEFLEGNLSGDGVKVSIGEENPFDGIKDCSIVVSGYGLKKNLLGAIGLIGPTRMPYKRLIPMVSFIANHISRELEEAQ